MQSNNWVVIDIFCCQFTGKRRLQYVKRIKGNQPASWTLYAHKALKVSMNQSYRIVRAAGTLTACSQRIENAMQLQDQIKHTNDKENQP